jgi:hypothetical protein
MNPFKCFAFLSAALLLASCGSLTSGNSQLPPVTSVNLSNIGKLQLAVGTAKLATGTVGLNVVTTFRQANGLSAVLVDTPSITGPSGFIVPTTPTLTAGGLGGSGSDAGTSSITSIGQTASLATPSPPPDTFGVGGGVFASGLEPFNETEGNSAYYPGKTAISGLSPSFEEPFYATEYDSTGTPTQPLLIGPPAVPFFNDGSYPSGFAGYQTGFTAFQATPVTGTYNMTVIVAASNAATATYKASATLSSTAPLPAIPKPTFTENGSGGGTASITIPAGSAITETIIYVVDTSQGTYYSSKSISGSGTLTFTLANNLGKCGGPPGCENNPATAVPSIKSGDTYYVYAASFDYPQFEAEPPGNLQQKPTITGSNGQADVTMSPAYTATY